MFELGSHSTAYYNLRGLEIYVYYARKTPGNQSVVPNLTPQSKAYYTFRRYRIYGWFKAEFIAIDLTSESTLP